MMTTPMQLANGTLEQIARDIREGTFPVKSQTTLREELLKRAERIINDGDNITYSSRMAAQHVRALMCELADALRAAPYPPPPHRDTSDAT